MISSSIAARFAALVGLTLCTGAARAATLVTSTTYSYGESFTDNAALIVSSVGANRKYGPVEIGGFDPHLGTLNTVIEQLDLSTSVSADTSRVGVADWLTSVSFYFVPDAASGTPAYNALFVTGAIVHQNTGESYPFLPGYADAFTETTSPSDSLITDPAELDAFKQPTISFQAGIGILFDSIPYADGSPAIAANDISANSSARLSFIYDYTPTPGVPEPATWAMMLVGFGGLGAAMRGRRSGALHSFQRTPRNTSL